MYAKSSMLKELEASALSSLPPSRVDDRRSAGKPYGLHANPLSYSSSLETPGLRHSGKADFTPKAPGSLEAQAGANTQRAQFYKSLMQTKPQSYNWPVKLRYPADPDIADVGH